MPFPPASASSSPCHSPLLWLTPSTLPPPSPDPLDTGWSLGESPGPPWRGHLHPPPHPQTLRQHRCAVLCLRGGCGPVHTAGCVQSGQVILHNVIQQLPRCHYDCCSPPDPPAPWQAPEHPGSPLPYSTPEEKGRSTGWPRRLRDEAPLSLTWDSSPSSLTAVSPASTRVFVLIFYSSRKPGQCIWTWVEVYAGLWQKRGSCNIRNGSLLWTTF